MLIFIDLICPVAQPRGQPGIFPPWAFGKLQVENVHIKLIKKKMLIYNYRVDKIQILLGYLY